MSIRSKIAIAFTLIISIFFVSSAVSRYKVNEALSDLNKLTHEIQRFAQLKQVQYNMVMQTASVRGFMYYKQETFVDLVKKHTEDNKAIIQDMIDTARNDSIRNKIIAMKEIQVRMESLTLQKVMPLIKEGKEKEANALARAEGVPTSQSFNKLMAELTSESSDTLSSTLKKVDDDINIVSQSNLVAIIVSVIFGITVGLLLSRTISRPVQQVAAEASRIAAGDLTGEEIKVTTRDEVGRLAGAFNTMLANLKEITGLLQEKSMIVTSSSSQLSASAENVAAGATDTASTVSEIAGTVEQVASNARHISETSQEANRYAMEGRQGINQIASEMQGIQNVTASSGKIIHGLNESSGKISQIVDLITQIAEQTNLLALNAAIEAARAGEQGRGFAVVAEEVRKLAEQSAGAAKEIYSLVHNIQQESQKAVLSMDEGIAKVEAGSRVINHVGSTFEKIIAAVQNLVSEIKYVASATDDISSAIQNLAATSEEQTATIEEVTSTSQQLAKMAEDLEVLAKRYRLTKL